MKQPVRKIALAVGVVAIMIGAPAIADQVSVAKQHFEAGTKAYDLGHYDEAVKEYEAAYRAKDDPALLFNIGQAYRGLGDAQAAIRAFRSYLRRLPDAPNRAEVESRIAELQMVADEQVRSKEKPPQGTLPPTQPTVIVQQVPAQTTRSATADELRAARTKRIAGLAVGGFGVASLVLGGVFTGLANDANRHIVTGDMWSPSTQDRRNTYQALDIAFFTIGGVAVATGLTLYLLGRHDEHKKYVVERATIAPAIGAHTAGLTMAGSFQ
jgi:tetratricopeptide (TPR) repeat protein